MLRGDLDAVVVFSGDGGFNEVLNGLAADPVGFVPGGGTSVLPRALGLPRDPVAGGAARLALAGPHAPDLARARERPALRLLAGIGLDAELVRRVDERGRAAEREARRATSRSPAAAREALVERRGRFEPRARDRRARPRRVRARRQRRSRTPSPGRCRCTSRRGARSSAGLDLVAPQAHPRARTCRGSSATCCSAAARSAPATSSTATTSTGSRSTATSRCRSRRTARTSATSSEAVFEAERDAVAVLG